MVWNSLHSQILSWFGAQSDIRFKDWRDSLPAADKLLLRIWRGGAIHTPTRRWYGRGDPQQMRCQYCDCQQASARHYWAECPYFESDPQRISAEYNVPRDWWQRQPRVTSKTGWITEGAHPSRLRWGILQVAVCRLGIAVTRAKVSTPDAD